MRSLKKVLSLVVVLAMAFSMMVTASAKTIFSDVSEKDSYAEAVSILNNLKILQGYEENGELVFKPNQTVTRAEMATIMVRTLGYGDPAPTATVFSDVPATHWASGYIHAAYVYGIVNGMGDGTFRPEDPVTYEQAVKLIVAALGYTPKATSTLYGGYPTGYLRIASEEGITKGIPGTEAVTGTAAKRSTIARLIFNSLEVKMMEQTVFTGGTQAVYEKSDNTILKTFLKVKKVQGVVTSTYLVEEDFGSRSKPITIEADTIDGEADNSIIIADEGNTNAADFLGYSVTAYVAEDESGNEYLAAIAPRTGRNVTLTIQFADLASERHIPDNVYNKIYYWPQNSTKNNASSVEIAEGDDFKVFINGKEYTGGDIDGQYFNLEEREEEGGFVVLLDNNNDGIYDYAFITSYTSDNTVEFVVEDIDEEEYIVTGGQYEFEYDPEDDEVLVTFIKDGKPATFEDIEIDDVITIVGNDDYEVATIKTVYISSKKVEGKVTAVDNKAGEYTIGGGKYKLSTIAVANDLVDSSDVAVGSEGVFYLNYVNKIVKADATAALGGNLGFLIAATEVDEGFDNVYKAKYVDEAGKSQVSEFATRVTVYEGFSKTSSGQIDFKKSTGMDLFETLQDFQGVIKYNLDNSGKINRITLFSDDDAISYSKNSKYSYDAEDNSYGVYEFAKNTVAFAIDSSETSADGKLTVDAITVATPDTLLADEEKYDILIFENDKEVIEFVLVIDPEVALDKTQYAFVITKVSHILVDDEEAIKIEGLQGGKTVSYTICEDIQPVVFKDINDSSYDYEPEYLQEGDAILLSTGKDGYVKNIQILALADEIDGEDEFDSGKVEFTEGNNDIEIIYGSIVDVDGSSYFYDLEDEDGDQVYVKGNSGTVYTLVDFTTQKLTISKSSSTAVKSATKYVNYTITRKVEGKVTEIIYYRVASKSAR